MSAIAAYPTFPEFGVELGSGRKIVDKTAKLAERVTTTVFDAVKQESIQVQLDHQFDVVISSVNNQLSLLEKEFSCLASNLEGYNNSLLDLINNSQFPKDPIWGLLNELGESTILTLKMAERSLLGARTKLEQSGIDRACVGECIELLSRVETRIVQFGALVELFSENIRIGEALLEEPMDHSDDVELNALLG